MDAANEEEKLYIEESDGEHDTDTGNSSENDEEDHCLDEDANALHTFFTQETVLSLNCKFCETALSKRGMRVVLIADNSTELYSTDAMPRYAELINPVYSTPNCKCAINDVACLGCGNVVGYHVSKACHLCLSSSNNGHYWLFHSRDVQSSELVDYTGNPVVWGTLLYTPERIQLPMEIGR